MPRLESNRARAALLGIAVGDALGWPVEGRGARVGGTAKLVPRLEFEAWRRREGGSYGAHEQTVRAGDVSDDTQLTLAVARSLVRGPRWYEHLTSVELPLWTVYERGGGGASKRASQSWLRGQEPWSSEVRPENVRRYFEAGGNGAAMRVLPHCIEAQGRARGYEELSARLDLDAAATHGHPRALVGSRVYGWAAWWALQRTNKLAYGELLERTIDAAEDWGARPALPSSWIDAARRHGYDFDAAWGKVVAETLVLLREGRDGLAHGAVAIDRDVLERLGAFSKASGSGTVTATAAIFLAGRYLSQPQQGLLTAAFSRGADTDTLAAMTAGLLGCLAGDDWLWPLSRRVQDADYVGSLAEQLLSTDDTAPPSTPFTTRTRTQLYRWLDSAAHGEIGHLDPFGEIRIAGISDHDVRSQFVRSWDLKAETGQTLMIKRYDKGRDGAPRWRSAGPQGSPTSSADRSMGNHAEELRAGLVLRVHDLERARIFYEQIVGLSVTRTSPRFVSFGWLALESTGSEEQLPLTPDVPATASAIRVYLAPERVSQALRALTSEGISAETIQQNGKTVLRTADPDGHRVEFWERNGTPPPV